VSRSAVNYSAWVANDNFSVTLNPDVVSPGTFSALDIIAQVCLDGS
jgi:hypothetical protein